MGSGSGSSRPLNAPMRSPRDSAREIATGTALIQVVDGKIVRFYPGREEAHED